VNVVRRCGAILPAGKPAAVGRLPLVVAGTPVGKLSAIVFTAGGARRVVREANFRDGVASLLKFQNPTIITDGVARCRGPFTHGRQHKGAAALLTESEVSRSWNKLFKPGSVTAETFQRAEALLDELRGESPLRHRLQTELTELQRIHLAKIEA